MSRARILLADDHPAICEGVAAFLESTFEVVGMVANGRDMLSEAVRLHPDVVVLDISMPLLDGISAAKQLRVLDPLVRIVFLTVHDNAEYLRAGIAAGALGYVLKRRLTIDLVDAVSKTLVGERFVSPGVHGLDEQSPTKYTA